jgi:hypothetical protein
LALKFELVTMLRSGELRAACRPELIDLNGANPRFDIPAKRVKKRRVIQQPLSGLAVEIIKEALESEGQQFVFERASQRQDCEAVSVPMRRTQLERLKPRLQAEHYSLCDVRWQSVSVAHRHPKSAPGLMSSGRAFPLPQLAVSSLASRRRCRQLKKFSTKRPDITNAVPPLPVPRPYHLLASCACNFGGLVATFRGGGRCHGFVSASDKSSLA